MKMSRVIAVGVQCLVVYICASLEVELPVVVKTLSGSLRGTRRVYRFDIPNVTIHTIDEFLGIPYAAPPVGERRFKPPEPPIPWSHTRDATTLGWVCPQNELFERTKPIYQSEDCLFLNIYSPYEENDPGRLYPIMVYIHGGSYLYGTGNRYNGSALSQHGVVLVSINYRLGALGFLSTGDSQLVGNYGLMDQMQALQWLHQNGAQFRGDVTRITVFGGSAGGASVGLLFFSAPARGLFHQAIAMSGTPNAMWATHPNDSYVRQHVLQLASSYGCYENVHTDFVKCLRKVDWRLFNWDYICQKTMLRYMCTELDPLFKPVIDGRLLKYSPDEYLRRKDFPTMPYMTGTVRAEFGDYFSENYTKETMNIEVDAFLRQRYSAVPGVMKAIRFEYTDWRTARDPRENGSRYHMYNTYNQADVLSDLGLVAPTSQMAAMLAMRPGMKVYLYHLNNNVSYHSVELNYVFGVPYAGGSVDEMGIFTDFNDSHRQISALYMTLWANFAKTGKPTHEGNDVGFAWNPVNATQMNYLLVHNQQGKMDRRLRSRKVALWNVLVPLMTASSGGLTRALMAPSGGIQTWVLIGFCITLTLIVVMLICLIVHGNIKGRDYGQLIRGPSSNSSNSYTVNL